MNNPTEVYVTNVKIKSKIYWICEMRYNNAKAEFAFDCDRPMDYIKSWLVDDDYIILTDNSVMKDKHYCANPSSILRKMASKFLKDVKYGVIKI